MDSRRYGRIELVGKNEKHFMCPTMTLADGIKCCAVVYQNGKRIVVHNKMLKDLKLTKEILFMSFFDKMKDLAETRPLFMGFSSSDYIDTMDILGGSAEEIRHFFDTHEYVVCTSRQIRYGGASLFVSGTMQRIGLAIGDFYVLPTSVNEFGIVPCTKKSDVDYIKNFLVRSNKEAGATRRKDIVSDSVFRYFADTNTLKAIA